MTAKVVAPLIFVAGSIAVMVVVPTATEVTKPFVPAALLIVAVAVLEELHVADAVRFCVVPSVYVPVAVNCIVLPRAIEGLTGVISIETNWAAVTVKVVLPAIAPDVAVIVVEPTASDVARPLLLIVATPVFDELQTTCPVKSCVVASVNVPVAINCFVVPLAIDGLVGVTEIEVNVAAVTVNELLPVILPDTAEIVVAPVLTAAARPEPFMVATPVSDELHVTCPVKS